MNKTDKQIIEAVKEQLNKSLRLKLNYPGGVIVKGTSPFFLAFTGLSVWQHTIHAQEGAITYYEEDKYPKQNASGELRVGSYQKGGSKAEFMADFPIGNSNEKYVLKRGIWKGANDALYEERHTSKVLYQGQSYLCLW